MWRNSANVKAPPMRRNVLMTLAMVSLLGGVRAKADDVAYAYCPLGEGYVFLYQSLAGFDVIANLKCGEQVAVLDTQDKDRARVRTANGKEGYVFKYTIKADASGNQRQPPVAGNASTEQPQRPPQIRPEAMPKAPPSESQPRVQPSSESRAPLRAFRHGAELEVFAAYSYIRANLVFSGAPLTIQGASSSATVYFNNWLGVLGDFGLYHQGNVAASGFSITFSSYQFGPTLRYRNQTHLTPFAHLIAGGEHAGGTLYTRSLGAGIPPLGASNAFLLTAGAGADWRLSQRITIRLVEADYLHAEFLNASSSGNRQENLRLSTGVVFTFGHE